MIEGFEPLVLDSNIRLTSTIASHLPSVKADVTRIRQVLSNLLTNALRHTPVEGEISLQVAAGPRGAFQREQYRQSA